MDEENGKKGFAGLSSLTSKIEKQSGSSGPVPSTASDRRPEGRAPEGTSTAPKPSMGQASTGSPPKPASEGSDSSNWKWFLGIAAVVVVVAIYSSDQHDKPYAPPSEPAAAPVAKPAAGSIEGSITFEKPPVGRDQVLSMAEIRWCLREDMRADVRRPLIDTNAGVSSFNQGIDDRNRRCGSFRYRRDNLDLAKRQVEELRLGIELEARLGF
jgi:hypothetical protein